MNKAFAIVAAVPASVQNPRTAAISATTKNTKLHCNSMVVKGINDDFWNE